MIKSCGVKHATKLSSADVASLWWHDVWKHSMAHLFLNTSQFSTLSPETLNAELETVLRFNTASKFTCQNHQSSFHKVYSLQNNMYTLFKAHIYIKKKKVNKLPTTAGNAN